MKNKKIFGLSEQKAISILKKHGFKELKTSGKEDPIVESVSKRLYDYFVK
jgi:hypothetical protein